MDLLQKIQKQREVKQLLAPYESLYPISFIINTMKQPTKIHNGKRYHYTKSCLTHYEFLDMPNFGQISKFIKENWK